MNQFFKKTLSILGIIWKASFYLNFFAILVFPACLNYNMDLNHVPKQKTVVKNTRFSYKNDLVVPSVGATGYLLLSPVTSVLTVGMDYCLITNRIKGE